MTCYLLALAELLQWLVCSSASSKYTTETAVVRNHGGQSGQPVAAGKHNCKGVSAER